MSYLHARGALASGDYSLAGIYPERCRRAQDALLARTRRQSSEQLKYLLFLKMAN
jgi:hypothetical protein